MVRKNFVTARKTVRKNLFITPDFRSPDSVLAVYRSTSPSTISMVPMMATTSAINPPRTIRSSACSSQHRPGDAELLALFRAEDAHSLEPVHPDAVVGEQLFVFIDFGQEHVAEGFHLFFKAIVEFILQTADAKCVRGEPRAAIIF